jgi:hypothetical protein
MAKHSQGFSAVEVVIVLVIVIAAACGGWYVWTHNHKNDSNKSNKPAQNTNNQNNQQHQTTSDPSEGGKYLVISEWGVRVLLPDALHNAVTYSLGPPVKDSDNNTLQSARLLLKKSVLPDEMTCVVVDNQSVGQAIDVAVQYIRSETDKPFDAARYKGTMKANILKEGAFAYHLNYTIPDCLGGGVNTQIVENLQTALGQLQNAD